ncbi:LuxR family transcriptional regulator [Enterobacteriaceae bacterium H18W14]|uniref:helix-turn-helix transcriptional regulator n=1 Tax=Dryocola boscaweniae TaxID=2925397 RepID=UPI0022F0C3A6|nr:LuxR C-terminal-related transcriptional regulator [Dryocola boscaweniae]MCT4714801.1 LuxR family transcriptional regulator [Dryocola boscaweniae]
MSEHLHLAARKRRHRRTGSLAIPTVFDRLEYLQQQTHKLCEQKPVDMLLLTHDRYLSLALTQHFLKRTRTRICSTLEEVTGFFEQTPLPRIVIDLDCITLPVLHVLDAVRAWHKQRPGISITLLTSSHSPEASCFIAAAAACRVIERRLEIVLLLYLLMQRPCSPRPVQANYTRANDDLSPREWKILMEVARGRSLKTIAFSLGKPYHAVVYTLSRVSARIGLNNKKSLIHLLHELSVIPTDRNHYF